MVTATTNNTIVLRSLSILLGLFFIFIGIIKITPYISKDLHRDLVSIQQKIFLFGKAKVSFYSPIFSLCSHIRFKSKVKSYVCASKREFLNVSQHFHLHARMMCINPSTQNILEHENENTERRKNTNVNFKIFCKNFYSVNIM